MNLKVLLKIKKVTEKKILKTDTSDILQRQYTERQPSHNEHTSTHIQRKQLSQQYQKIDIVKTYCIAEYDAVPLDTI